MKNVLNYTLMMAVARGLQTRWYHLKCIVLTVATAEEIAGLSELTAEQQTSLHERVQESQLEVDEEAVPLEPDSIVRAEVMLAPHVSVRVKSTQDLPSSPSYSHVAMSSVCTLGD
jgi:hypothetical protein